MTSTPHGKFCAACSNCFQDFPGTRRTSNLLTLVQLSKASSLERLPQMGRHASGCTSTGETP